MNILDDALKTQGEAKNYLDALGENFLKENKGKTVVVFPDLKEHVVVDDPIKVNDVTSRPKYQKTISFIFTL